MSEQPRQHAVTPLRPPGGMLRLTVRLPAVARRKFAVMCAEIGISQQDLVSLLIRDTMHEYYVRRRLRATEGEQ